MGGSWKSWGSQNFFMRNIGGHKNNQEIIGWLQILLKILFNEIAPKMLFSALRVLGVTCFFNIVAPEGGHKFLDHQIKVLVSNNCFSHRNVFQNGINILSKMVNHFLSKSLKFCLAWTIRFCSNFTSMWSKYLSNNVWRDFRLPMSVSVMVT